MSKTNKKKPKSYLIILSEEGYDLEDPVDFPQVSSYGILHKPIVLVTASSPDEALKIWSSQQGLDDTVEEQLWNNHDHAIFDGYSVRVFEVTDSINGDDWIHKFYQQCQESVEKDKINAAKVKQAQKEAQEKQLYEKLKSKFEKS